MKKYLLALAAVLMLPSMGLAFDFTLDYNEASYTSSLTDTFDIGQDFGPIESAQFSLYIAGRRFYDNGSYYWSYDSDVTLSAEVLNPWAHMSLPSSFDLYTFQLTDAALIELETTGTFSFTLTGNSAYWESSSGGSGFSNSRFFVDYAALDVTEAPEPATLTLVAFSALGLMRRRARRAAR